VVPELTAVNCAVATDTRLVATNESTALGFIDVLELVTLTTLESNDKLVLAHLASTRAVEDSPVAPCALSPPCLFE